MLIYKTLEDTNIEILHSAFIEAFSDYQVKMNLPLEKFKIMLKSRAYAPKFSVGAFKDDRLVGFILNGIGNWRGKTTLYDCGTGVIPEYRKQGITSNIFREILSLLKNNNIEHYLLEVIQSNEPAVNLYKKQGFIITRTFSCFRINKDLIKEAPVSHINYKVCNIEQVDWDLFKSFWDFEPSWQNSIDAIRAVSNLFEVVIAQDDEKTVGYGIIDRVTGTIPQLAVHKDYRRKGIGHNILNRLIQCTESNNISFVNIDDKCASNVEFLKSLRFENFVDQYEMILNV